MLGNMGENLTYCRRGSEFCEMLANYLFSCVFSESSRHNRAEKRKLRKIIPYILSTQGKYLTL